MSLNICSDGHDEVCYDGRTCPACSMKDERNEAQEENKKLLARIESLEEDLDNCNGGPS